MQKPLCSMKKRLGVRERVGGGIMEGRQVLSTAENLSRIPRTSSL
jgi:hypothetical protein